MNEKQLETIKQVSSQYKGSNPESYFDILCRTSGNVGRRNSRFLEFVTLPGYGDLSRIDEMFIDGPTATFYSEEGEHMRFNVSGVLDIYFTPTFYPDDAMSETVQIDYLIRPDGSYEEFSTNAMSYDEYVAHLQERVCISPSHFKAGIESNV